MKRILSTLIVTSLVASSFIACSKGKESSEQPQTVTGRLLNEPLLNKIPQSAELFYLGDISGDAYQKVKNTAWWQNSYGPGALQKTIDRMKEMGADESRMAPLQILMSTLQNLGLTSSTGESTAEQVLSKAVLFAGLSEDPKQPVELGVYIAGAKGASLKSKLPILRQALGDADLIVSAQQIGGVDGLVARPAAQPEGSPQEVALYIAASDSLMAISLTESGAASLFSSANTNTIKTISETPEFQKAVGSFGISATSLGFGYLDVKKLVPVLNKFSSKNGASEEDLKQLQDLPVDGMALAQGYDQQMMFELNAVVSGRTATQTKVLSALEGGSIPTTLARLPSDTAFAFGLDTRFISKLGDALNSLQDPSRAAAMQQVKDIQGLTFGMRNSDGSSPIPDIFLVVDASNRDALASNAETMIGQGMAGAMGTAPQWSTKDIDGTPIKFITTMFGAGVYLGSPKGSNTIMLSSTERALKDLLEASAGRKGGIADSLQASLKESFAPSKLFSMYFNPMQTATLLESAKSSIAMFAGPSPELDQALNTESMKKLGLATGSISYSNGLFVMKSILDSAQIK